MGALRVRLICVVAVVCCFASGVSAMSVDEALARLKTYRFGQENEAVNTIREATVGSFNDPATRQKLLAGLTVILESDAPSDARHFACRQLALIGAEQQVPALVKLLVDRELSQIARYALARIPGAAVDRALIDALGRTDGANKLGVISTLGNRRCAAATEPLAQLLRAASTGVVGEAARALGRIGTPAAAKALEQALAAGGADRAVIADAYLECADRLVAGGDRDAAARMYERILVSDLPGYVQGAALQGCASASSPKMVVTEVVSALKRGDRQLQSVAAQVAREIPGPEAARVLLESLPELPVRSQAWLIRAMAGRRDAAVATAVAKACESDEVSVRVAALEVLGTIGDVSSVPVLIEAAAAGDEYEGALALRSLVSLPGDDVNKLLLSRVERMNKAKGQAMIQVLVMRQAVEAVPTLLKMARTAPLQSVSIAGLQNLASAEHIPAIVDLLESDEFLASSSARQRYEVCKMLVAVAQRCQAQAQASRTLAARLETAKDAGVRETILLALGELGDEAGLSALRRALNAEPGAVQWAAIAALSRWPNAEPLPDLLRIANDKSAGVSQVRALGVYIDLVRTVASISPEEKVRCFKTAMDLAPNVVMKRRVFGALASVRTLASMQLAAAHVQDEDAGEEAALAAVTVGEEIYAGDARPVAQILEQIALADVANSTKERARRTLDEIKAVGNYLTEWEVAGPYEQEGKNYSQLFDIAFDPEKPKTQVAWRKMPVSKNDQHPAYLDLLKELDGGEQKVAYLRTRIESSANKPMTFEIFSDDGVKAWLNGKVIHANNVARAIAAEPDRVNVTLNQGANTLMLKVTQNNMPWGAVVRMREMKVAEAKLGEGWRLHTINADSRFEAAGVLDVNRDGKLDILCGGFWYEAPDWKRYFVREIKEEGNYYYDFANLPMDVDGDGWMDTAGAAWHNKMVYWVRNPGKAGGPSQVFEVDTPGNMETAMAYDINGDGQLDVLPNIMTAAAWYEYRRDTSVPQGVRWQKHPLPKEAAGHGLGAGDVNRDGRCDVVTPKGWLEQTADGWQWRPEFELGYASIPILVHDVDGDGDSDIVWGLGHNYGVYWMEQKKVEGQRAWEKFLIDDSWSQPHYLLMADLDNDGQDELVTGKRYYAHNGNDPGGNDPRCVYFYDFDVTTRQWTRHTMHEGGRVAFGINTMAADIDADGDIDVVAPGKSGLYLFENLLK